MTIIFFFISGWKRKQTKNKQKQNGEQQLNYILTSIQPSNNTTTTKYSLSSTQNPPARGEVGASIDLNNNMIIQRSWQRACIAMSSIYSSSHRWLATQTNLPRLFTGLTLTATCTLQDIFNELDNKHYETQQLKQSTAHYALYIHGGKVNFSKSDGRETSAWRHL